MRLAIIFLAFLMCCDAAVGRTMPTEVYLRGEDTGWGCNEKYRFTLIEGTGIYTLSLPSLKGEFKIADRNFDEVNYGCAPFVPREKVLVQPGETQLCLYHGDNFVSPQLQDVTVEFDHTNIAKPLLRIYPTADYVAPEPDLSKPSQFYLRGDLHGYAWEPVEDYRFKTTAIDDVYTLTVGELYGNFKISNADWSINYGASSGFKLGDAISLDFGGKDIQSKHIVDATLTLDLRNTSGPLLTVDGTISADPTLPSGIYIIGKMYGSQGEAEPQLEFRHLPGSDVHTLEVSSLYESFHIGTPDCKTIWLGSPNAGWEPFTQPGTYRMKQNGSVFYTTGMTDVTVTLDMSDPSAPAFSVIKHPEATARWKSGYKLRYAEEFEGESLNSGRWSPFNGTERWGHWLLFEDTPEAMGVEDSALRLTMTRHQDDTYSAGMAWSLGKLAFRYGKLEIRMKQTHTTHSGVCVGLWLEGYHHSWPTCAELDVIEHGVHTTDVEPEKYFDGATIFPSSDPDALNSGHATFIRNAYSLQDSQYHTYTMYWDADHIAYYLDEDLYPDREPYYLMDHPLYKPDDKGYPGNYFNIPFFIYLWTCIGTTDPLLQTALSDANGRSSSIYIDYVRIYQKDNPDEIFICNEPSDEPRVETDIIENMTEQQPLAAAEYYDLSGRRVSHPQRGVYICRQGSSVSKLLIK